MKTPRIEDFDPNAPPTLGSPMDDLPAITKPGTVTTPTPPAPKPVPSLPPAPERVVKTENVRSNERTNERPNVRPIERTAVRMQVRHSFDIFEDQLRTLQGMQLEAVQAGKTKPTLGEMVQEALDLFLANRRGGKRG